MIKNNLVSLYLLAFLFHLSGFTTLAQSTIESLPNQKLINGSYVSNPDHILDDSTVGQIDTLLTQLEKNSTAQVGVVVVESIGNQDIFDFAQKLFTSWGIGNVENDNGLLILFVNDQRTVRFHTGLGLEGVLIDAVCKRIQRDYMVPEFKNGNYNAGMLAGLQQVNKILSDPAYAEEIAKPEGEALSDFGGLVVFLCIFISPILVLSFLIKQSKGRFKDSKHPEYTAYPEMRKTRLAWVVEFLIIPVAIITLFGTSSIENAIGFCCISLYLYFMGTLFYRLWKIKKVINRFLEKQDYYEIVDFLRKQQWYWFFMALLFPLPFAFYFVYHLFRKRMYRDHPRNCKECQGSMRKLNEKAEDEYLTESQQVEEKIKAVNYDVWQCKKCSSIEMWFYLNPKSKFLPCPKCKTIAYHSVSKRTITQATYSSDGKGEEVHACQFCGIQKTSTYKIAQLVASTSSSSSYSSSGSSSSSSGSSWGGGSSGGGGASSSW